MAEHTSLAGKRILLSGGTTGIGRATVHLLAQKGARVMTSAAMGGRSATC